MGSAELNISGSPQESDIDLQSLAGGIKTPLASVGGRSVNSAELALKADAFMVNIQSSAATGVYETEANSHRFRLALTDQRRWPMGDKTYSGGFELGARLDGGDAADGYGMDIGANAGYTNTAIGLSVYSQGRLLLLHSEDYSEWGLDVTVRLRPRFGGRRLALLLEPGWGQRSTTNPEDLWDHGAASLNNGSASSSERSLFPDRTHLSLSYGVQYRRTLLQPFLEMGMQHTAVSDMKLGLKFSSTDWQLKMTGRSRAAPHRH